MNTPHLDQVLKDRINNRSPKDFRFDKTIKNAEKELLLLKQKAYSGLSRAAKMDEIAKFDIETRQIAEILNTDFEMKSGFFEYYLNHTYRYKYQDLDLEFVRKLHFEMLSDGEFNLFTKAKYAERWILK